MFKLIILATVLLSSTSFAIVIRGESRTKVTSPASDNVAKKVGILKIWNNNSSNYSSCSATLIAEKYILTAAHCVINLASGRAMDNIVFYPQYINNQRNPSRIFIKKGWVLKKYINFNKKLAFKTKVNIKALPNEMIKNDIALLEVYSDYKQKDAGTYYGYLSIYMNPELETMGDYGSDTVFDMKLYSYPGDKPYGTMWKEDCYLQHSKSNLGIISCDTYPGASGSSVYQYSEAYDAYHVTGVVSAQNDEENIIVWFTTEVYKEIVKITSSKTSKLTLFKSVDFKTKKKFFFNIHNKCDDNLRVAFNFKTFENEWKVSSFSNLSKGQVVTTAGSKNSVWYYWAQSKEDDVQWSGSDTYKDVFGSNRGFNKKNVKRHSNNSPRWGDHYLGLTCNDK